jgi:hypothetical protein
MTEKVSQATLLVELALDTEGLELFRTPNHDAHVLVPQGTHRECWPVRSTPFRRWLQRLYFEQTGSAPGSQALQDALGVLEGKALFNGEIHEVHLRLTEHEDAIYIDLADDFWQAIRIDSNGWEIVPEPPVRFRRARGMLPLPHPVRDGSLDELRQFVNVDDADWPLYIGWLIGTLRPRGPYAIVLVHGEQGSAKSTLVRVSRALVDPNEAPVRREPKNGQDLIVAARNGLIVAFDNVSRLPQELSDDLARLATGSGFGARQLYTDLEEVIVHVARPIALNGIEEVATKGDVLDRSLLLMLPTITRYEDEDEFWSTFTEAHPRILGALLDAVSCALANLETTATPNVRMADFARWVTAAEPALGLESGTFINAYRSNRAGAVQLTLEASLLTNPVQTLAEEGFTGTATELLDRLATIAGEELTRKRGWPARPHLLSGQLRRLAPALRRIGIEVEFSRIGRARTRSITVGTVPEFSVPSVRKRPHGSETDAADAADADSPTESNEPNGSLSHEARERVKAERNRLRREQIVLEDTERMERGRQLFADDEGAIKP